MYKRQVIRACNSVDRVSDSGPDGRGFNSRHAYDILRKKYSEKMLVYYFYYGITRFRKIGAVMVSTL